MRKQVNIRVPIKKLDYEILGPFWVVRRRQLDVFVKNLNSPHLFITCLRPIMLGFRLSGTKYCTISLISLMIVTGMRGKVADRRTAMVPTGLMVLLILIPEDAQLSDAACEAFAKW